MGVSHKVVRRLIDAGKISATQVVPWAPWEISVEAVQSEEVLEAVRNAKRRVSVTSSASEPVLPLFGLDDLSVEEAQKAGPVGYS